MPTRALREWEIDRDWGCSADAAGSCPAPWQWLIIDPPIVP